MLEALENQPDPVEIEALATSSGRHPNTLREQIEWLVSHGYVERIQAPVTGRGRPRWLYQATRSPAPLDGAAEYAAGLTWNLAKAGASTDEARAAGRAWGERMLKERERPPAAGTDPRQAAVEMLDELGYEPEAEPDSDRILLHHCPLLQIAHGNTEVACALHVGMVEATIEHAAGTTTYDIDLQPFSAPGQCRLSVRAD